MQVIGARNVHHALPTALWLLDSYGVTTQSRNGPVKCAPEPVTTKYTHPRERVMFWPSRDANPFFHFYESLWMLAGSNEVEPLAKVLPSMREYSDDGKVFHGAYGYRWRRHFAMDQLKHIAKHLREDHNDRRQVLQMWDASTDLVEQEGMKDLPCNLVAHFQIRLGALDMTVFNRSNDIVWGCYGANAVHFSMLQEVMAAWVGVPVGTYWQVSDNWHGYVSNLKKVAHLATYSPLAQMGKLDPIHITSPYEMLQDKEPMAKPFNMVNGPIDEWFEDLNMFIHEPDVLGYRDVFFRTVAVPMMETLRVYRDVNKTKALITAKAIKATDWRHAVVEWIQRRLDKAAARNKEEDNGATHEQG